MIFNVQLNNVHILYGACDIVTGTCEVHTVNTLLIKSTKLSILDLDGNNYQSKMRHIGTYR